MLILPTRNQTASYIADYAKSVGYDLVLCGKESIDYNNGSTGVMIAELLDVDYIGFAENIQVEGNTATVKREMEGGEETDTVSLPVVIACQKGVCRGNVSLICAVLWLRVPNR